MLLGNGCPAFPRELAHMVQLRGEIDVRPGQFWIARGPSGEALSGAVVELLSFRSKGGIEETSVLFWRPCTKVRPRCPAEAAMGDLLEQGGADSVSRHRGSASSTWLSLQDLFGAVGATLVHTSRERGSFRGSAILRVVGVSGGARRQPVFGGSVLFPLRSPFTRCYERHFRGMAPYIAMGHTRSTAPSWTTSKVPLHVALRQHW